MQEVKLLLRICECVGGEISASKSLRALSARFALGVDLRTRFSISPNDRASARKILVAHSIDPDKVTSEGYGKTDTGSDALDYGPYEKHVASKVKVRRVSIKAFPGQILVLNQAHVSSIPRAHLDIALDEIKTLDHDSFLVVENYETFDEIHRVSIDVAGHRPVVVYRGDPKESRADFVNELLRARDVPVFVFGDLDPKGLVIAAALPNFRGLVLPNDDDLEHIFGAHRRKDLYDSQVAAVRLSLDQSTNPSITRAWEMIRRHAGGLVQQVWMGKPYRLMIDQSI